MLSRYVSSGTRCFVSRVILIGLIGLPVLSADDVSEENRPVDDVLQAFDALAHHGEWLGFHNGAGAPARTDIFSKNHIQGLARSPRPGTPYFFLCSSGAWLDSGDSDANLMVVEMGSRDESGERLRSTSLRSRSRTSSR